MVTGSTAAGVEHTLSPDPVPHRAPASARFAKGRCPRCGVKISWPEETALGWCPAPCPMLHTRQDHPAVDELAAVYLKRTTEQ